MRNKCCPLKFNSNTLDTDGFLKNEGCSCEGDFCMFFCSGIGDCALVIQGIKLAQQISIKERKEIV